MNAASHGAGAWRLSARLARREVRRSRGRTALVALLVGVPVAFLTVASVWVRTSAPSEVADWVSQYGDVDVAVYDDGSGVAEAVRSLVPSGSEVWEVRSAGDVLVITRAGDRMVVAVSDWPIAEPSLARMFPVAEGRAPTEPGEVALSPDVAERLDVGVGEQVDLRHPVAATWEVVGIGHRPSQGRSEVIVAPGTEFAWPSAGDSGTERQLLADLPDTVGDADLAALGRFEAASWAPWYPDALRRVASEPSSAVDSTAFGTWLAAAVTLAVVAIVISAAFASSARRQLTTLGHLAANGAPPVVLRRVLLLQGTFSGLVGAAAGSGIAAAVLLALVPHRERMLDRAAVTYDLRPADLVPIVALAVVAATAAAVAPARSAGRVSVLEALAGRRPEGVAPRWLAPAGAVVMVVGTALLALAAFGSRSGGSLVWAAAASVGGVAVLFGGCGVTPAYVALLGRAGSRLDGAWRMAARSLARQRSRSAAVVSAVGATAALAVAAASMVMSMVAQSDDEPREIRADEAQVTVHRGALGPAGGPDAALPDAALPDAVIRATAAALPDAVAHQVRRATPTAPGSYHYWELVELSVASGSAEPAFPDGANLVRGTYSGEATIADDALLDLYDVPAPARQALSADGSVLVGDWSGTVTLQLMVEPHAADATDFTPEGPPVPVAIGEPTTVTVVDAPTTVLGSLPRLLVTEERADALGLAAGPVTLVHRTEAPLTDRQRADVVAAVAEAQLELREEAELRGASFFVVNVSFDTPASGPGPLAVEAALSMGALALCVLVVAANLALSAAETRDERRLLEVLGARPAAIRSLSGAKAWLLTVFGTVAALPVALVPVAVLTGIQEQLTFEVPWRTIVVIVGVLPVVAALLALGGSAVSLRLRPVRASVLGLD